MAKSTQNVTSDIQSIYKTNCSRMSYCEIPDRGSFAAYCSYKNDLAQLVASEIATKDAGSVFTHTAAAITDVTIDYDSNNNPLLLWRQFTDGKSIIMFSSFNGTSWTPPEPIPAPAGQMGSYSLCRDYKNMPWLALETTCSGRRHIFITWFSSNEWGFAQRVSDGDGHSLSPALCPFGDGVRCVWETRLGGRYIIFMREMDTSPELPQREDQAEVVSSSTMVANASITAIDDETSVVVWEQGQKGWGQKNRVFRGSRGDMTEGNFLMAARKLHAAVISPDGIAQFKGDMNEHFDQFEPSAVRTLPKVAAGDDGSLWLSFRQIVNLDEAERHQGFYQLLSNYHNGNWSQPVVLPDSSGDCDLPASFSRCGNKLLLSWHGRQKAKFHGRAAALPQAASCGQLKLKKFKTMKVPDLADAEDKKIRWLGEPYNSPQLLFGDIHRHTSISGCRWWCDGSPQDAYRYALQAAELDFMALTDHGWDLSTPETRRHLHNAAETFNAKGLLTAFCAYEMSMFDGDGHMVVLTGKQNPEIPKAKTRKALYKALAGEDVVIIPHHPGDPNHPYKWEGHNEKLAPVAEIYQPYRTAFEQADAPKPTTAWIEEGNAPLAEGHFINAWRAGLKIGVVASSDHLSTDGAYACVWAKSNTAGDILSALRQRHCYAATTKIELEFFCQDMPMGSEIACDTQKLEFRIFCRGTGKIKRIDFLAGGEVANTFKPGKNSKIVEAKFSIASPAKPQFYYLRVLQADGEMAWSSPIWIELN